MNTIAIIGLGYVGLPLAVEFGKSRRVIGFDINRKRVAELTAGKDETREINSEELSKTEHLTFTFNPEDLGIADIFIVTVPTPINKSKQPELEPLIEASRTVGRQMSPGALVIYESTVYPGCTRQDCVPLLEEESGLVFNKDFGVGYSPERINPGDMSHRLVNIVKVTSGSNSHWAEKVDNLYNSIIKAGTYLVPSIEIAEAAKVIENSQRDLNIAFVNELALIFDRMGLDTDEVLNAAGTKWNFLPFKPGLVGGHCIGVDPYYLTYKAESLGYRPEVILSGRRINDNMGTYIVSRVIKMMVQKGLPVKGGKGLVLGITFKENCPDIRNTRSIDIVNELRSFGIVVDVMDPYANKDEVKEVYNIDLVEKPDTEYNVIILAVSHNEFLRLDWDSLKSKDTLLYDVKSFLSKELADKRL